MAVAQTSKTAYGSLANLGEMQSKVHEAIGELGLAHDQEILDYLGIEIEDTPKIVKRSTDDKIQSN